MPDHARAEFPDRRLLNPLHACYRAIQRIRKRIEEISGWMKTVTG